MSKPHWASPVIHDVEKIVISRDDGYEVGYAKEYHCRGITFISKTGERVSIDVHCQGTEDIKIKIEPQLDK